MPDPKFVSVESTTCFSFSNLVKKVKKEIRKKFPDESGEEYEKLMLQSLRAFKINDQTFDYESINTNLGGIRWYVKCPKCGKPCIKLYLPSQYKNREQKYLCKTCHRLKNISLLIGPTKRYREVVRPLRQLEKIKKQLLGKNMTPERASPLLDEYERIERNLVTSPAYRLWKFQKENIK